MDYDTIVRKLYYNKIAEGKDPWTAEAEATLEAAAAVEALALYMDNQLA